MNSIRQGWTLRLLALAIVAAIVAPVASAQDQGDPVVKKLLEKIDQLENRVIELESDRSEADGDLLESRINALAESLPTMPGANHFDASWQRGLTFQNEDRTFQLRIGGQMDLDWAWGTQDDDLESGLGSDVTDATGAVTGFNGYRFEDGVAFRRARINIQGRLHRNIVFRTEYDFRGGDAEFTDVYAELQNVAIVGHVRVGHFKQPFGLEQNTLAPNRTFVARGLATNAFTPNRETGLMLWDNALENDRLFWALSVFRDVDAFGDSNPRQDGKYGFAARMAYLLFEEEDGSFLVHIGGGFLYNNPINDQVNYRTRPGIDVFNDFFGNTGNFVTDDIIRLSAELAVVYHSFAFVGEYFFVDNDGGDVSGNDPTFWGAYAEVSYFLTGERRPYDKSTASFGTIVPHENALEGHGGLGAWQVAARYDFVDLNDDVNGGEVTTFTLALNWYLNPNAMIRLNYIYADLEEGAVGTLSGVTAGNGEGEAHILALRFQLVF